MKLILEKKMLKIDLVWWEKLLSCHGSLEIPLCNIETVSENLPQYSWKTIRCPGTGFPWVISAGTFYAKREKWDKEFLYCTRGKKFLVIDLKNESYRRVVLGVENPAHWIREIKKCLPV
jgi:hypothetical protein